MGRVTSMVHQPAKFSFLVTSGCFPFAFACSSAGFPSVRSPSLTEARSSPAADFELLGRLLQLSLRSLQLLARFSLPLRLRPLLLAFRPQVVLRGGQARPRLPRRRVPADADARLLLGQDRDQGKDHGEGETHTV